MGGSKTQMRRPPPTPPLCFSLCVTVDSNSIRSGNIFHWETVYLHPVRKFAETFHKIIQLIFFRQRLLLLENSDGRIHSGASGPFKEWVAGRLKEPLRNMSCITKKRKAKQQVLKLRSWSLCVEIRSCQSCGSCLQPVALTCYNNGFRSHASFYYRCVCVWRCNRVYFL